jgi:hypothetical protein
MSVHLIHDLSQGQLIVPFKPATAVCGLELAEAHEIVRPDADAELCDECLSWSKRNRYQNTRCAVEMSAPGARKTDEAAGG